MKVNKKIRRTQHTNWRYSHYLKRSNMIDQIYQLIVDLSRIPKNIYLCNNKKQKTTRMALLFSKMFAMEIHKLLHTHPNQLPKHQFSSWWVDRLNIQLLDVMIESSHCHDNLSLVNFSNFFEEFWQTNGFVYNIQNFPFYGTLMALLPHVQSFRKNRRPFPSKCFGREQLGTATQSITVYFQAYTHGSTCHHLYKIYTVDVTHCFAPTTRAFFEWISYIC